jgi:hypothetical protein
MRGGKKLDLDAKPEKTLSTFLTSSAFLTALDWLQTKCFNLLSLAS